MISSSQYRKRLTKLRRNIYNDGKLVDRDFKRLEGAVNIIAKTYDMITDPEFKDYQDILTATSHLTGKDQPLHTYPSQHRRLAGQAENDQDHVSAGRRLHRQVHGH